MTMVFDLNFAGTSAAIVLLVAGVGVGVAVVLVVAVVVVVDAFLLLPPQPAARTATRARTASPGTDGVFRRCMVVPFLCGSWAPCPDELANRMVTAQLPRFPRDTSSGRPRSRAGSWRRRRARSARSRAHSPDRPRRAPSARSARRAGSWFPAR